MGSRGRKAYFEATWWALGAAILSGGALVIGCGHDWGPLEPISGAGGSGGAGGAHASSSSASTAAHTSSGDGDDGTGSFSSSSSGMSAQAIVGASVAACLNEGLDDAAACEQSAGQGQMTVDMSDPFLLLPNDAFVRFDLDGTLTGKTIDAVTLALTVASSAGAGSDHSGEVWKVSSFTWNSLDSSPPSKLGNTPIGPDQGAVSPSQMVKWALPASLAVPNTSVCLGVYPKSDDNVNYWNKNGSTPPVLVISYH